MDKIMSEFSKFLKESEGNEDMKSALDTVVNELLTKDTLYEPMKTLRDEYPIWLENNWDKVSH
jgi:peroxin-19